MSLADAPASHDDRKVLVLRLAELGIPTTDTEGQRHVCAVWTGGLRRTRSELTKRDVGTLLARLSTMTPDELAGVRRMPVPHTSPAVEEATAALAAAAQDGIELDEATTPAVDPAACLASWDVPGEPELDGALRSELEGIDPLAYPPGSVAEAADDDQWAWVQSQTNDVAPRTPSPPHGGICPCDACNIDPPEEEHVPEPDPAPAGSVAPAVPLVAPLPVAPPPPAGPAPERVVTCEPPRRTPEEVEAAAEAAVARFRERAAAGIVPEPPDRLAVPRRVPLDLPPHPGRYCLCRCYCGGCPQHAEQAEAAERGYRQELTAARNKDLRTR